jgi:hypothetical protein
MNTVMIRKSDGVVVAFMSTATTAENMLGNASPNEYDVLCTEEAPIIGAIAEITAGEITNLTPPTPPPVIDYKELYAAAKADSERIAIIAQKLGLI